MNCDMFRVFDGEIRPQCAITETYIDDYLDKRAPNCPLGIITCKDCKYWNKETEYCKHWSDVFGRTEDSTYRCVKMRKGRINNVERRILWI